MLDKPAGWSVMGERHDTDVVRLARDAGETLWPAHRIDKVTSGLVLFARRLEAHGDLTRQFADRTVAKTYLAVATGTGLPERGTIDLPLSVGRKNRVRIAAPREAITRDGDAWTRPRATPSCPATTTRRRRPSSACGSATSGPCSRSRRRRGAATRIRVHLAWIGHALVGDPLFAKDPPTRTGLHAWRLAFTGPDGTRHELEASPGEDFRELAPAYDFS